VTLNILVDVLADILDQIEGEPQVVALGASGLLGLALKERRPGLTLTVIDLPLKPDHLTWPDMIPVDHGGHLLAAWQCARDGALFRPWHRPDLDHALDYEFDLDASRTHERAVDLLRAANHLPHWTRALSEIDAPALLAGTAPPLRIAVRPRWGAEPLEGASEFAATQVETCLSDMSAFDDVEFLNRLVRSMDA